MLTSEAVRSIVVNLVENARKYAPVDPEQPGSEPIRVVTRPVDGTVALEVLDRGPGIPEPERSRIFQAFYRMGNYQRALTQLERAVVLEPSDPDVNNHLGDVYWRLDRQLEARFQWQRVLSLDPDAKLKAEVETKLKSGLPPLQTAVAAGP